MRGIEADALSASYAEGVRDGKRQAREELSATVMVRGEAVDVATFDPPAAEKARGPDPLLVQAREALLHCWQCIATGPLGRIQVDDAVVEGRDALAALDAKLGGKT
jgi:hypothetical protein